MTQALSRPNGLRLPAQDEVGAGTLERLAGAERFNRWMYDRLAPWLGDEVLEVGSGIGNLSRYVMGRARVLLTDTEPAYRSYLQDRFGSVPGVRVTSLTLPDVPPDLTGDAFDSVMCLNVLEHIERDVESLVAMRSLLRPGGSVVLLVPALSMLYGELDRHLGHVRRYSRKMLRDRYRQAGLALRHIEYFNLAGVPGWWFVGRVLKRAMIPPASLRLYDALVPLFRLERLIPWRLGQSLIAIGRREAA